MTEIDVSNTDKQYWEKVLAESNLSDLGDEQQTIEISAEQFREIANVELLPEEDNQREDEPVITYHGVTKDNVSHSGLDETNDELRTKMDADSTYFTGHRIIKPRHGNRECPIWATEASQTRRLLLQAFPKLVTDEKQRAKAGRWARVIQLYFRVQLTEGQVAGELNLPTDTVKAIIRSILRVSKGVSANGTGTHGRKRGRPRKSCPVSDVL